MFVINGCNENSARYRYFISVGLVVLSLAPTSLPALPLERQQELVYLLKQDCGSCHGMTLKGGLGPSLLAADLQPKGQQYLQHVISQGVENSAMPAWKNILKSTEIHFLVNYLLTPSVSSDSQSAEVAHEN